MGLRELFFYSFLENMTAWDFFLACFETRRVAFVIRYVSFAVVFSSYGSLLNSV